MDNLDYKIPPTISVLNHKGGVAKTTNAILLAEYQALIKGRRVLIVDNDPQCNCSARYLRMEWEDRDGERSAMPPVHPSFNEDDPDDLLWGGRTNSADIFSAGRVIEIYGTHTERVDILPGDTSALLALNGLNARSNAYDKTLSRLRDLLRSPDISSEYDIVIIDTGPNMGFLNVASVRASTHVLIPTELKKNSIDGVQGALSLAYRENLSRTVGDELHYAGVVINKFDKRVVIEQENLKLLNSNAGISQYILPEYLYMRSIIGSVSLYNAQSVFSLPERDSVRREVEAVCSAVDGRVFG